MKNLEFIDALWHWIKQTSYSEDHIKFLEWLGCDYAHLRRYPNLIAYLNRDNFYIREEGCASMKLKNTFKKHLKASFGQIDLFPEAEPTRLTDIDLLKDTESCV